MTVGLTCALPECCKPVYPSPPGRDTPHLTCGNLHHLLLMAGRFDQALPNPHLGMLERHGAGVCALSSCASPPRPDHLWCSKRHYLQWLFDFISSFRPEQFCKLDGCSRHVFVGEDFSRSEFCGWRHCQEYVVRSAMPQQLQPLRQQQSPLSSTEALQVKCGTIHCLETLIAALRTYASCGKMPKNAKVDEDFFRKHPWELCIGEGSECLLIVPINYSCKGKRVLRTKDGYHWKQQGPPIDKGSRIVKYFAYRKLNRKQGNSDECMYHMDEYTVPGVKDYSVIKVVKARRRRQLPVVGSSEHSAPEFNCTPSPNIIPPLMSDEDSFPDLPPLDGVQEFLQWMLESGE